MTTLEKHVKRGAIKTNKGAANTLPTGRNGLSESMEAQMDYSANANKKRDTGANKSVGVGKGAFKDLAGA